MTVEILNLSTLEISTKLADFGLVYEVMYNLPAGTGTEFVQVLTEHSQREGFRLYAAYEQEKGQLVGFGYGFTGWPGQFWRDSLAETLGAQAAGHWLIGHFEFAEFGLIPAMRRQGIGTRLYKVLFSDLPQRRAVLTVRTGNRPARQFYEKHNWIILYQDFFTPSGSGPYVIMGREIGCEEV